MWIFFKIYSVNSQILMTTVLQLHKFIIVSSEDYGQRAEDDSQMVLMLTWTHFLFNFSQGDDYF
jgi:hypothetical protein